MELNHVKMFWPVFGQFLHLPASLYTTQPLVSCFSALARCLVKTDTTVLFKAAFRAVTLSTYNYKCLPTFVLEYCLIFDRGNINSRFVLFLCKDTECKGKVFFRSLPKCIHIEDQPRVIITWDILQLIVFKCLPPSTGISLYRPGSR